MLYTIGEMAKKLEVAPSTLRYYEKEGLLPFVERSNGGIRMFGDRGYELMSLIGCLKESGMSIKDIKIFIKWMEEGDSTIDQRLALFERQRQATLKQMEQLQETLDTLNYKCWYYETAKKAGTCAVHENMTSDDIPENVRTAYERMKGHL
ncbi:MAG: MerR family transcriptional regulator [Clostridia bacterium]|jgi:DNA-binding transcriptional MerR regulator|nr:MerR family transcriptional regulator [Lachnospiraceae bacterium]NCC00751.1 MerR family transcriptional regulator [Clostridia bacterium]NCD03115.1 MerR family transcriptional regulator [Clostridia bacterium]